MDKQKLKELAFCTVAGAAFGCVVYLVRDVPNAPYICAVGAASFTVLKDSVKDATFVKQILNLSNRSKSS
jgi:hypothetical protein